MAVNARRIGQICTTMSMLAALATPAPGRTGLHSSMQEKGRRLAFVVGNDAYPNAPLKNGKNDARAIAMELGAAGLAVTQLYDVTKSQFNAAFAKFVDALYPDDVVIFYFAGHGVQVAGENYLIPAQFSQAGPTALQLEAIKASDVQRLLARARVRVLILDACRTNPFLGDRSGARGLARMEAAGSLVAMAAGPGQVASDNLDDTNGLYTRELLKALRVPGLSLREIMFRVRESVYEVSAAQQFPEVHDQLLGDIVLRPVPGAESRTVGPTFAAQSQAPSATPPPSRPSNPDPDNIVIDDRTGLFWMKKDIDADIDWEAAMRYCENLRLGGFADWRVPAIEELEGVYDPNGVRNMRRPLHLTYRSLWSATKIGDGSSALFFDFIDGRRYPLILGNYTRVMCVRGGGLPPAP
jgi:Caspase domain/Protein of unknown function (DUF1566)